MSFSDIAVERKGPVVVIRFDRPEVHNCIGPRTHDELVEAWEAFNQDATAKVAVLTGTGDRAFSSGGDLSRALDLMPQSPAEAEAHDRGEMPGLLGPSRRVDIYKPIVAAINGLAYAGGLEWACFADIRIAEEHATFGVTCRRWNIGLADGGTQRLPRIIGLGRALDLIVTGRVIDAREAERIGLVSEVVPKGQSLARALDLAGYIASLPQEAIRTDKEAAVRGFGLPLHEGLRIEAECFNRLVASPALREGLRKFLERDHPDRRAGQEPITPGLPRSFRPEE